MNVQAIIANVIDRCGGDLITEKLPTGSATLHVLNQMEMYGLELTDTFKGITSLKATQTWSTREGVLSSNPVFLNRPQFVRYRFPNISPELFGWNELFVLNDIEELTHAENVGRKSVLFTGLKHPYNYQLSFDPVEPFVVEIHGQNFDSTITNLSEVPKLPEQFSQLIAVQASMQLLDELLLLEKAGRYQAFCNARKQTLLMDLQRLNLLWVNFKERDENRNLSMTVEPFDIFSQMSPEVINIDW